MIRTKIDYGIDLGTTNSAISRMENGTIRIIKSLDTQKDTTPSCIAVNQKGNLFVGDKAYLNYRSNSLKNLSNNTSFNSYIEFKRTMGTDKKYHSSFAEKDFSSEELSAEVLKRLKEYIQDENISAVIVTVPAAFKNNQIDATRKAAQLAGFSHIEVLQEPVAASMAYGLENLNKDGFWLVFDFGGGTFDTALLKVEDGIMRVVDTEGDNYLGGKNLDFAIVDQLILPHIQDRFSIHNILSDDKRKAEFRNALKFFAEEIKNNLSFNASHNIYVDPGDCGEDDEGEEIDIDLTITQEDLARILTPVFQRAVDLSLKLIERNNLKGSDLESLILVGGPTLSPILRKMLESQIRKPDTNVDPMTVVSKGAALYASTIDIAEDIIETTRDKTKIQLEIGSEASTVETEEFITIKILEDKTEGAIPEKVFAEIKRGDNAWSSGKIEIDTKGEIIDVHLEEGKTNIFKITLYDNQGNSLECQPNTFTIIQGSKIGNSTLPYNWGVEILSESSGKVVFQSAEGLEKNKSLPAIGVINGLKTQKQIRPGMDSDFIKIPLYQGEHNADGTRAIYNDHVYDIIISGSDLPTLLPENSQVDLTISIDRSQEVSVEAFFPYIEYTTEIKVPTNTVQSTDTDWLANEIKKAKSAVQELESKKDFTDDTKLKKLETTKEEIENLEKTFENDKNDVDNKQEVLTNLRRTLKVIDELSDDAEWPTLEAKLKETFYKLEKANQELGDDKSKQIVEQFRKQLEIVLEKKDIKLGNALFEELNVFYVQLTLIYQLIGSIQYYNENFGSLKWKDANQARSLINRGMQIIGSNPTTEELHPIVVSLIRLVSESPKPPKDDDGSRLRGK